MKEEDVISSTREDTVLKRTVSILCAVLVEQGNKILV